MARKVKDRELDSREARARLKPRGKPYWRTIERGLHLGYRRLKGRAGTWCIRHYVGKQAYQVEGIGPADDLSDPDGIAILSYWQAVELARKHMVERAHTAAGNGTFTVKDAVERYLEHLEGRRKNAYDARRRAAAFIYPELGDTEVVKLTTDQLRKWHVDLAKARPRVRTAEGEKQKYRTIERDEEAIRRRRSSANRVLTILKAGLNHAYNDGKVPSDVEWRRVKPFEGVDGVRTEYLKLEECKRLINAADADFRPLILAGLLTGARYGQLTGATVADFDADNGTLRVSSAKGRGASKTYYVNLTNEGVKFFRQLAVGRARPELLLRRKDGTPWKASHQARPMREACERARIKPAVPFHLLRHTWASLTIMGGASLLIVARNLGHADTRMVERAYGKLAQSHVKEVIEAAVPQLGFKPDKKIAAVGGRP
jgi:integrase